MIKRKEREREYVCVCVFVRETSARNEMGGGWWTWISLGGARWGPQCAVVVRAGWITYQSPFVAFANRGLVPFHERSLPCHLYTRERTSVKSRENRESLIPIETNDRRRRRRLFRRGIARLLRCYRRGSPRIEGDPPHAMTISVRRAFPFPS